MSEDTPTEVHCVYAQYEADCQGVYDFLGYLGRGATAEVYSAVSRDDQVPVAIRRISTNFFDPIAAKRILRELRILKALNHENITPLRDLRAPPSYSEFNVLSMVVERMDCDLRGAISVNEFTLEQRQHVILQVCLALKYVASANLLHRDIKPDNILINGDCHVKVADFNLSRIEDPDSSMTEYVTTRWYRAPELLLSFISYDSQVDMWSLGCVLAEMITGTPLFEGKDPMDQINKVAEILGKPTENDLRDCLVERAREYIEMLPDFVPVPFEQLFPTSPPEEIDFLRNLLMWNPVERLSVGQALQHPYLCEIFDPTEAADALPMEPFEFEGQDLEIEDLKRLLWEEVRAFHPEYENLGP
jgi:mitogen-activated protein kinase 1/3